MFINRKARRSGRRSPVSQALRPMLEAFEKRELLTGTGFLQGTVFADPTGGGVLSSTTTPLSGAMVSLFAPGNPTAVSSFTTLADGNYYFGNLTPGTAYTLVETPPASYASTGAQALSQIDKVGAVTTTSIQVTAVDSTQVLANYQGILNNPSTSPAHVSVTYTVGSSSVFPSSTANQLIFNLTGDPNVNTATFNTYCVDAADDLFSASTFNNVVVPQSAMPNGDRVAYLYNHYGLPGVTPASFPTGLQGNNLTSLLAGVQIAIWDLEYNNGAASGANSTTGFNITSINDPSVQGIATALVADSAGKSEKVAIIDASLTGVVPSSAAPGQNTGGGAQSVLAAKSFDFFNNKSVGALSGFTYVDANNNGVKEAGETPISGVLVTLNGIVNGQPITPITATTGPDGSYNFGNLAPGSYTVTETQPAGYLDGLDAKANVPIAGSNTTDVIAAIPVTAGSTAANNNFGEQATGSLSGFVYVDASNNGLKDTGETPLSGVTLTLTGTANGVAISPRTTTTAGDGSYSFGGLAAGSYTVTEAQPAGYLDGLDAKVNVPIAGSATTDVVAGVPVATNANTPNNNFGELLAGGLSGFVYVDANNNGLKDSGEAPISGVTVTLTGTSDLGTAISPVSTTTAGDGSYSFGGLRPGSYTVTEAQPAGYADGLDAKVNVPIAGSNTTDVVSAIPVTSGAVTPNNNFGEQATGGLSGFVYVDYNNNGIKEAGETPISGVTLTLTGSGISPRTTTTAGDGSYSFGGLAAGNYVVTESQPAGYIDGQDARNNVPILNSTTTDSVSAIPVVVNATSPNNNFGELATGSLSGFVYVDASNNGLKDAGEAPISGVTLTLTGTANGVAISPRTTTTASDGSYSFGGLAAGSYTVTEAQPAGYLDGLDAKVNVPIAGSATTDVVAAVPVSLGSNTPNNNFGELLAGGLSGFVYVDANNNGLKDSGEAPISGVTVTLTGTSDLGTAIAPVSTTTAGDGSYSFGGLRPGSYTVTEAQPAGYADGLDAKVNVPIAGSNTTDVVSAIPVTSGAVTPNNNFGELANGSLSGFVYVDYNNNGLKDSADTPISGVTLTLTGMGISPRTTTTASDGSYSFGGLAAGSYTVTESQPAGYIDGLDAKVNVPIAGSNATDVVAGVPVATNANTPNNNFGELLPAVISGTVYFDVSGNGLTGPNNAPLPGDTPESGVTVTLYADTNGNGVFGSGDVAIASKVTGANGTYSFGNLAPGTYFVQETTPSGYVQTYPTTGTYTVATNYFGNYPNKNFANFTQDCHFSQLTNVVYRDNGCKIPGLRGNTSQGDTVSVTFTVPAGVTETLSLVAYSAPGSSFSASTAYLQSIVDVDTGTFTKGTYTLSVTLPNSYYQVDLVCGAPITQFGPAGSNIFYSAQNRLIDADNGGCQAYATSSISGVVYLDNNGNGVFGSGDGTLANVPITLTGTTNAGAAVSLSTTTSSVGTYSFNGLAPGLYAVTEAQPAGYITEVADAGNLGGTAVVGAISGIAINSNSAGTSYNFGELITSVSGTVYNDATGNGLSSTRGPLTGDTPQAGVTVKLLGANNAVVATTTSASDGTYSFTGVPLGTYTVVEVVPNGQIETGPTTLTYPVTLSMASPTSSNDNFANYTACNTSTIKNVTYKVNGCGPYSDLSGRTNQGNTVSATFTVTGSANQMVSLVSYVVPNPNVTALSQQVEFSLATGSFTPGVHTISITLPCGYYQVDFVCGAAISQFGPSGSNVSYRAENRLISADSDGWNVAAYCPPPLANVQSDIGTVGTPGTLSYNNGTYTLTGSGSDFWGQSDAGNYVYQALTGDGELVARVTGVSNTDSWAKAGVMIRQSLDPGSAQASVFATPGNGVVFQDRSTQGGSSSSWSAGNSYGCNATTPVYVKIVRVGNTVSGYNSSNGINWQFIGSDTINLGQQVYIGLAVTAHNSGAVATATFDSVSTSGYWASCSGQSLIQSCGGRSSSTSLSSWLAQSYPNLYGSAAGCNNLWGKTNNDVADYCQSLEDQCGAESLECQALSAALQEYFTSSQLGGQYGKNWGFNTSYNGFCSTQVSLGCNTDAFAGCSSTTNVWNMLQSINNQSCGGIFYAGNASRYKMACNVVYQVSNCGY